MVAYSGLEGQMESALDGSVGNSGLLKGRVFRQLDCYLAWEVEGKDSRI